MKELIKITKQVIGESEINAVDGRELHEFLENKYQFSNWIQDRIIQYNFIEGVDFVKLKKFLKSDSKARMEYILSIDMSKELCMVERNQKGKEARLYFIECERKLKEKQNYNSENSDPVIALLEASLAIRTKQLELETKQDETDKRLVVVEKHLAKKAEIQDVLPDVKVKTMRSKLNEVIRSYVARRPSSGFSDTWNVLFSEFYYRNRVNLKVRANNANVTTLDYAESAGFMGDLLALALELFC